MRFDFEIHGYSFLQYSPINILKKENARVIQVSPPNSCSMFDSNLIWEVASSSHKPIDIISNENIFTLSDNSINKRSKFAISKMKTM